MSTATGVLILILLRGRMAGSPPASSATVESALDESLEQPRPRPSTSEPFALAFEIGSRWAFEIGSRRRPLLRCRCERAEPSPPR
jgi:hypothetical protein